MAVRFIIACAFVCALLGPGCNSAPTLPLPPPVVTVGTPSMQGLVLVEGEGPPLAYISIFNLRTESGVITRADTEGRFQAEIEASAGDTLSVWAELDGEVGERKEVEVRPAR